MATKVKVSVFLFIYSLMHTNNKFANAIVNERFQVPTPEMHPSQTQSQVINPNHPSWSSLGHHNEPNIKWNHYLNKDCQIDNDCFPTRTLLYCISSRCKCISKGATFLNGIFYNYNMEWNDPASQCFSQTGSPCTLKEYWYSPETVRMECVTSHQCVPLSSSIAKGMIAAQGSGSTSFGSQVAPQPSRQLYAPYFGSGVSSFSGTAATAQYPPDQQFEGSKSSTANTIQWGICVAENRKHEPHSDDGSSFSSGNRIKNSMNNVVVYFNVLAVILVASLRTK
ncbi:unnamed protein product [Orchesella dallaii]|uniref:Uncharacterized protein n=1 Tax=Orchesella dallaii TaxID=48710 RepID=A0ABP1S3Q3_9HEXA